MLRTNLRDGVFVRGVVVLIGYISIVVVARQHVADVVVCPRMCIHACQCRGLEPIQMVIGVGGVLCAQHVVDV